MLTVSTDVRSYAGYGMASVVSVGFEPPDVDCRVALLLMGLIATVVAVIVGWR